MSALQSWIVRPAHKNYRKKLLTVLDDAEWRHQHLDWLNPEDLLDEKPFLLCFNDHRLAACLACPRGPESIAWIRILAIAAGYRPEQIWGKLWPATLEQLHSQRVSTIAALIISNWLKPLLVRSGFQDTNALVFFRWDGDPPPPSPDCPGNLRQAQSSDFQALTQLDQRAFRGLWANSSKELMQAFQKASFLTLIESGGKPIGYQISTFSAWGIHLSRLAVEPHWQGSGIGTALVTDLLHQAQRKGHLSVTVNTQEDNLRSIRLYQRLGFHTTGDRFVVMERRGAP